jgi:hypothetical protein
MHLLHNPNILVKHERIPIHLHSNIRRTSVIFRMLHHCLRIVGDIWICSSQTDISHTFNLLTDSVMGMYVQRLKNMSSIYKLCKFSRAYIGTCETRDYSRQLTGSLLWDKSSLAYKSNGEGPSAIQHLVFGKLPVKYTNSELLEGLYTCFKCHSVQAPQQEDYATRALVHFRPRNVKQSLFVKNVQFLFVMRPNSRQTVWQLLRHPWIFSPTILTILFQAISKHQFSMNMCTLVVEKLVGPFLLEKHLTAFS